MDQKPTAPLPKVVETLRHYLGDKSPGSSGGWNILIRELRQNGYLPHGKSGAKGRQPNLNYIEVLAMLAVMLTDEPPARACETLNWISRLKPFAFHFIHHSGYGGNTTYQRSLGNITEVDGVLAEQTFDRFLVDAWHGQLGPHQWQVVLERIETVAGIGGRSAALYYGFPEPDDGGAIELRVFFPWMASRRAVTSRATSQAACGKPSREPAVRS